MLSAARAKAVLTMTAVLFVGTATAAHAYLDPGTGSLMWQLIAASFLGVLFYVKGIFGWFAKRLGRKKDAEE